VRYGPIFCAVAVVAFILIGPVGPCGPSSALGLPLLLIAWFFALCGWVVCGITLMSVVRKHQTRSHVPRALLYGTLAAAVLALIAQGIYMAHGERDWWAFADIGVFTLPPLVTMVAAYEISKAAKARTAWRQS
jgi:hypothetical protein